MTTFVVAHGGWSAGWAWKKMRPLLRDAGHALWTPTYAGLGERAHLFGPGVDLDTHIADVIGVIQTEELRDIVLVGHSYGGVVATGVADRIPDSIAQIVYLDAFMPRDGQSLFDLQPPAMSAAMRAAATDGRVPPTPVPSDTPPEDAAWITRHRMPHPVRSFEQKLRLAGRHEALPRCYVYCTRTQPGDPFGPFAQEAREDAGCPYYEMDASHSPHITAPAALAALLHQISNRAPA